MQFVFGTKVSAAVFGQPPDLSNLDANGDLAWQTDYRTVYAAVLTDWFGLSVTDMQTVLNDTSLHSFPRLFKPQAEAWALAREFSHDSALALGLSKSIASAHAGSAHAWQRAVLRSIFRETPM